MTLKQLWSTLRGHKTESQVADKAMTSEPDKGSLHWYGKALEYKQMHEMAVRREADLEHQIRLRTTERDYHLRMANKLAERAIPHILTGDLFNELLRRVDFDGMDPRTFSLAELERAIPGAQWPTPINEGAGS